MSKTVPSRDDVESGANRNKTTVVYLLIAVVVAIAAIAGVMRDRETGRLFIEDAFWSLSQMRFTPPIATSFGECAQAAEPPVCLITKAAPLSGDDARGLLDAAINAGAVRFVRDNSALLIAAAQGRGTSKSFTLHVVGRRYTAEERLLAAGEPVLGAAIALAAAAQIADDPFAHTDVVPAIRLAGESPEVAQVATTLWEGAAVSFTHRAKLVRPRGLKAIWMAVVASPPPDTELLSEFARNAGYWGFRDEGLALWRVVLTRENARAEEGASAKDEIRMAERRQRQRVPDAAWVKAGFDWCMRVLSDNAYQSTGCRALLSDLAQAGATRELATIADAYLRRARGSNDKAEYKTIWFALASEAYRLAGDRAKALAAAREGLPFVAPALRSHWHGMPPPPMTTLEEKRRVASMGDGATEPVVALYRAGAKDEALRTGFLSGYHRYQNADVAGETPDPQWVVDDSAPSTVDRLVEDLTMKPQTAAAAQFYDDLKCGGPRFYQVREMPELERNLALLAALAGRRSSIRAHLARAAIAIDKADGVDTASFRAQLARDLAGDWRRSQTIAERGGITDMAAPSAACAEGR